MASLRAPPLTVSIRQRIGLIVSQTETQRFCNKANPQGSTSLFCFLSAYDRPISFKSVRAGIPCSADKRWQRCLSVCQTRALWQNGRKICRKFLYHTKDHL